MSFKNLYQKYKGIAAGAAVLFLFAACVNEVSDVRKVAQDQRLPLEVQKDLTMTYTDSTYLRMRLKAPLAENYPQLERPRLEFRKGIKVKFFDEKGNEDSRLRAEYAVRYTEQNLWEARGDVVVVNDKGEQLNTEVLFWDQKKEIIYSNDFVKITTPEEIIMGEGFQADQGFNHYKIKKVTGTLNIEDDAPDA